MLNLSVQQSNFWLYGQFNAFYYIVFLWNVLLENIWFSALELLYRAQPQETGDDDCVCWWLNIDLYL